MNTFERPVAAVGPREEHINRVATDVHHHLDQMLNMLTGGTHTSTLVMLDETAQINLSLDEQPLPEAIWEPFKDHVEEIVRGVEMGITGQDTVGLSLTIEFEDTTTSILLAPNDVLR